jgi:hypothetical protein
MSSKDPNKPPGKPGRRNGKANRQRKKPDQAQHPIPDEQPDRQQNESELIAAVASTETFPAEAEASTGAFSIEPAIASTEPASKGALVPIGASPIAVAVSLDAFWIGFRTIANAYRAYTWRSLEETISLAEKLTLARSLDKAVEIQHEYTTHACESFLTDSHKIWRLYSEFAKRIFQPFGRLVTRVTEAAR